MLITGSRGKLGQELLMLFPDALHPGSDELNVTDKNAVFAYIEKNKPDVIVHLAAATDVRKCEAGPEWAYGINVTGTEHLIEACRVHNPGCYFVYMSTACVFFGDRGEYTEEDVPHPKNFYALTKLLAEFVVKRLDNHLILRGNFVARETWPYPKAFTDRFGTYLFADDLARAIKDVLGKKLKGLVHVAGKEKLSMFELAKITTPDVAPMTMEGIDLPLTKDMSLRSVKIAPYELTKVGV